MPGETETALAFQLKKAGYDLPSVRLYTLAAEALKRTGSTNGAVQHFHKAIQHDRNLFLALCRSYIEAVARDMANQTTDHKPVETQAKDVRQGEDAAGHFSSESQIPAARPVPQPRQRTASERRAALQSRAEASQAALTVMDTHRLQNGRIIGDIAWGEIPHLQNASFRDAWLLRQIHQQVQVADKSTKIRDAVNVDLIQRLIQKSAEFADVAA